MGDPNPPARTSSLLPHEVARPLELQRLEAALNIRPFINEVDRILSRGYRRRNGRRPPNVAHRLPQMERMARGVVASEQELQSDRIRLYNFSSVGPEREWLRDVLLSSSDTSSDEETPDYKDRRIKQMLKERALHKEYLKEYQKETDKTRYMYYGAGLLSTVDRYPERRQNRPVPSTSRGRRGRPSERGSRGGQRGKRGRPREVARENQNALDGNDSNEAVDWEEQLRNIKQESDHEEISNHVEKTSTRGRKKLSTLKTPEALTARRRRHWQLLAKKELGKVQRARAAAHKEATLQRKRLAALCCKHWRQQAMQSQKNMKETVWRCKRLSREMQVYWKRYDRAERETRRRMEKEAEEQRKMDVELMEAKRQRRKLNFLITQTELYAHFMQKKLNAADSMGDNGAEEILSQLDEDRDPRLAAVDNYDSETMKARAARNAREAIRAERARTLQFDAAAGTNFLQPNKSGDYDQPDIFHGTLKGYQLKGMNWLANLYDQGISGILADEMGLGKTVQCIAFLCHVAERLNVWGPFLVVSPASTLHNWQQEMERFVPDFKVVPYWGSPSERKILRQFWERKDLHTRQAAFHVVITSYQIVVSDLKYLNRVSWQYMILDEAQAIKSSASMRWKLLLGFSCRNRLLLSGTPIQNSMAELWALLHFIMPTLFDSHEEFNEWFSKDIESHAENKSTIDEKHLSRLHMILKPFMLRRIKKDVENELSDKIEIIVHCPLTMRQKLLYIALKKKIKIEELLNISIGADSGHSIDKNFTSNLMNLVMQFRKVCNHPELFERRDVKSPFAMQVDDYHIPKILAEEAILLRSIPSKRHLLYNKLSILNPVYVNGNESYAFARFMDLTPIELYDVTLGGWFFAMQHITTTLEKNNRLRHRKFWWSEKETGISEIPYDRVRSKHMLLICLDGDVLGKRKEDGDVWRDMLFTDPTWVENGPFFAYTDHTIHCMPETIEHRAIRTRKSDVESGEVKIEDEAMFPHIERPSIVRPLQPTAAPYFLTCTSYKVLAPTRQPFAVSRSFAYHTLRHQCMESIEACSLVKNMVANTPRAGIRALQVPDKNQLVSDAGKLTVLDSLLKKLKEKGSRVLIYSQMTKMIDLLEEYMWHRKHKYMRLDGSSKISARRDMVADFQARADIFVFLLSTRAGGLGINLTAADTVIFYDSDWNPTVDQQAMDRAHRLGQTKQVTVYRLLCRGTIEERIMQRAREKSEIQRMVISGGNFKPDTLKPKEVVSLLLDDEEIELKYRQKSEEKKLFEERERKRKGGALPSQSVEAKRPREDISVSEPASPLQVEEEIVVDSSPQSVESSFSSIHPAKIFVPSSGEAFHTSFAAFTPPRSSRGRGRGAGARRGRGRGRGRPPARNEVLQIQPVPHDVIVDPVSLIDTDSPLEAAPASRGPRRGPGRPRLRSGAPTAGRGAPRRPRRPREPLLVPLAPPPQQS